MSEAVFLATDCPRVAHHARNMRGICGEVSQHDVFQVGSEVRAAGRPHILINTWRYILFARMEYLPVPPLATFHDQFFAALSVAISQRALPASFGSRYQVQSGVAKSCLAWRAKDLNIIPS